MNQEKADKRWRQYILTCSEKDLIGAYTENILNHVEPNYQGSEDLVSAELKELVEILGHRRNK